MYQSNDVCIVQAKSIYFVAMNRRNGEGEAWLTTAVETNSRLFQIANTDMWEL